MVITEMHYLMLADILISNTTLQIQLCLFNMHRYSLLYSYFGYVCTLRTYFSYLSIKGSQYPMIEF